MSSIYDGGSPPEQAIDCLPPGVRIVRYEMWGSPGQASMLGQIVPAHEVWQARAAGIITEDGSPLEWMLQIYYPWPSHIPSPQLVTPLHRLNGVASFTPVLALNREVLLLPGETLSIRVCGISADKRMGIRYTGWAFPIGMLPHLLRLPEAGPEPTPVD